jgi:hypothetical protein
MVGLFTREGLMYPKVDDSVWMVAILVVMVIAAMHFSNAEKAIEAQRAPEPVPTAEPFSDCMDTHYPARYAVNWYGNNPSTPSASVQVSDSQVWEMVAALPFVDEILFWEPGDTNARVSISRLYTTTRENSQSTLALFCQALAEYPWDQE